MEAYEIKEYLKQIFDIEIAIYTHKKIISDYKNQRNFYIPEKPQIKILQPPQRPDLIPTNDRYIWNQRLDDWQKTKVIFCYIIGIFLFVIGLLGICVIGDVNREIFNAIVFDSLSQKLLLLVPIPVGFAFIYSGIEIINNEKKLITKKNSDYLKQYEDKNELFIIRSEQLKQSHKVASQEYALTLQKYKAETDNQITQMNNILTDLDNRKNSLYSLNIIYPKYRNLVAISSLFEYFESGRCSSLEGADGAYNMYEYELRSNIIINSLSQIIEDLGKIKNNQYALYETIQESNQTVSDLLKNINNTQTLTAYYAKTAAIAASADRYVTAIMH